MTSLSLLCLTPCALSYNSHLCLRVETLMLRVTEEKVEEPVSSMTLLSPRAMCTVPPPELRVSETISDFIVSTDGSLGRT